MISSQGRNLNLLAKHRIYIRPLTTDIPKANITLADRPIIPHLESRQNSNSAHRTYEGSPVAGDSLESIIEDFGGESFGRKDTPTAEAVDAVAQWKAQHDFGTIFASIQRSNSPALLTKGLQRKHRARSAPIFLKSMSLIRY